MKQCCKRSMLAVALHNVALLICFGLLGLLCLLALLALLAIACLHCFCTAMLSCFTAHRLIAKQVAGRFCYVCVWTCCGLIFRVCACHECILVTAG